MKHSVNIGVVCLARTTFDYQAAAGIYQSLQQDLSQIENTNFVFYPDLVIEPEDAQIAAQHLLKSDIDGLVVISGTFHLGHLALILQRTLRKPICLWGLNELPYDGGKIRLNSVCGVNLNASNLYKSGIRNYFVNIGDSLDQDWVDAIRVDAALTKAHIGLAGFRAKGFFNVGVYDLGAYQNFGFLIDHYELSDIFSTNVSAAAITTRHKQLSEIFDVSGISGEQLQKVAELAAKLDSFLTQNAISALAIRCWPEFARDYGISPCAAMSLLQSEDRIIACEGDIDGAISMLAHRAVGASTPYLFDFSQIDIKENFALLWHCGVAPCNLRDGVCNCSLDTYFAGGKGVTADFTLKPGEISILRFDSVGRAYRLFLKKAQGHPTAKELKGTYVKVTFDEHVSEVLETVVYNGIAHHASMAYGDFIRPFEIFARIKNWEVIS